MNILPGSANLRAAAIATNQALPGPRPAGDFATEAQRAVQVQAQPQPAAKAAEPPRQDKVATAYRFERPLPPPRPNAPRGSTVNLLV
jgi:hypothetical protein